MRKVNGLRDDITRCIHFGSKILSSFKINRDRKLYMINYYAQRQNTCTLSQTNFVVSPPPFGTTDFNNTSKSICNVRTQFISKNL